MDKYYSQSSALSSNLSVNGLRYTNVADAVAMLKPSRSLYVLEPNVIARSAADFVRVFPGKALYAVKTNPHPKAIKAVLQGGVEQFDVASLAEIKLVKRHAPLAEMHFMHPIKTPEDIHAAYFNYNVRNFVLDHKDELFKIMRETELAQDLNMTVRITLPKNDKAQIDFSSKFGANFEEAVDLLQKCRPVSRSLGISFHVGTQTKDAEAYARAIGHVANVIRAAGVAVDTINVGGGFPVAYDGDNQVCTVADCVYAIEQALEAHDLSHVDLLAEPGRVLVAKGGKLVARVELRKGDTLYINDGVYGGLFDAAKWLQTRFPVSAITCDRPFDGRMQGFRLMGPTCDSIDTLDGAFILPADIGMGDWIVFENCGAYSQAMRSDFNGFGASDTVCIYDRRSAKS